MTNESSPSQITVAIVTRNRKNETLLAIQSCYQQVAVKFEVLVYVDASEDDTAKAIVEAFPQCRLVESVQRQGYIHHRNRSFHDAQSPIVVSLDDDAYFTDPHTLERIVELFGRYPKAAAFALPYVEPNKQSLDYMPKLDVGSSIRSYVGCAHAVRVQAAIACGEYPELLVHQGEERHLCISLWNAQHEVLFADTLPIVHTVSPRRENARLLYFGYRNTLLFYWLRAPVSCLFPGMVRDAAGLMRYRMSLASFFPKLFAIFVGGVLGIRYWPQRKAVSVETWRRFRRLPRHGPLNHATTDDSQLTSANT